MNSTPDFGPLAALGIVGVLLWLVFTAGAIALSIWITYTVVWRAVRRGLREFYGTPPSQG